MPRLHLTDVVVSRLSELGTYIDKTTPAFGLRVGKNRKAWFVIRGRERLRTTIGLYPAVSLADARKETAMPTKAERVSFGEAYETFKKEHLATKKPRTVYDYTRILDKYYLPKFEKKKLSEITYEAITDITNGLAGTPREQAHALAVLFQPLPNSPPQIEAVFLCGMMRGRHRRSAHVEGSQRSTL